MRDWSAAAVEVLLLVAIAVSSTWSVLTLASEGEPPHAYDVPLISAAIAFSVLAACASLAAWWAVSAQHVRLRTRLLAARAMPFAAAAGLLAALLTALPAEWGLLREPYSARVPRMQRLAASQCAIAGHVALAALRLRAALRWRALFAEGAAVGEGGAAGGPPAAQGAAAAGQPDRVPASGARVADSECSAGGPSSLGVARFAPEARPAPTVVLWEVASWALTVGAVLTVNWGFVTCSSILSDLARGCASFHSWAIEWTVFALWPIGSALALSALAGAHVLGRACVCRALACGLPFELMVVRSVAVGQGCAAAILLAVVAANGIYGSSKAGALGADLQLGPGIGSLCSHAALAVMRARQALYVRAHTTFGSAGHARREPSHEPDVAVLDGGGARLPGGEPVQSTGV